MKRRRIKIEQFIPSGPEPTFTVVVPTPGATYWHFRITDSTNADHRPQYRHYPPKSGCQHSPQEFANRLAGELAEARGIVSMVEWIDGLPTFSAIYIANSRQVYCYWSTDPERAKPVDLAAGELWRLRISPTLRALDALARDNPGVYGYGQSGPLGLPPPPPLPRPPLPPPPPIPSKR